MNWLENFESLKKYLNYNLEKGHIRHNLESASTLIPFKTRGDDKVDAKTITLSVGEFSRIVSGKNLKNKIDSQEICDEIIDDSRIEYEGRELKNLFSEIIKTAVQENLNSSHLKSPYFLKFLDIEERGKRVRDIALYIHNNLYKESQEIVDLFTKRDSNNLLLKLLGEVLENRLEIFQYRAKEWENLNPLTLFPGFSENFNRDLQFLGKYPEYFMKNIEYLFNYYVMMFIFQIIININRMEKGDFLKEHPLYFAVDTESCSIKRKSHTQGYKYLREISTKTYYHMNALEHFGILFKKKRALYHELDFFYNSLEEGSKREFIESFIQWMEEYKIINRVENYIENPLENSYIEDIPITFRDIYRSYLELIENAHSSKEKRGTYVRYTSSIEEIAKENFLKARGSLGFTFNLTQNFILFFTSIVVKESSLQAKNLFREFEIRGIYLDSPSKEKVLEILEKNNLIEKKSDGGEVQYVKPLL